MNSILMLIPTKLMSKANCDDITTTISYWLIRNSLFLIKDLLIISKWMFYITNKDKSHYLFWLENWQTNNHNLKGHWISDIK
jgi:hypothetical protein